MRRHLTTGLTLAVGVAVVCLMAVWGFNAATAPLQDSSGTTKSSTDPTCEPEAEPVAEFVRRGQVTVSVYNTGKRSGRARSTLDLLENAGFKPGAIGNGTEADQVVRAEVRTTKPDDKAAELVALSLGKDTKVVVTDEGYGPGVDVFIGDKFGGLDKAAPRRIELPTAAATCD